MGQRIGGRLARFAYLLGTIVRRGCRYFEELRVRACVRVRGATMRVITSVLCLVMCIAVVDTITAAESDDASRGDAPKAPSYHRHRDTHHGHNHVYPDRGAIVGDLPLGAVTVNYAGFSFRFADGIWFEPRGPAYIVVAPPIGLLVPSLPPFASTVQEHGEAYLYANDVYYRARPDLGGYLVVNDPVETAADTAESAAGDATAGDAPASAAPAAAAAGLPLAAIASVSTATPLPAAVSPTAPVIGATAPPVTAAAPPATGAAFATPPVAATVAGNPPIAGAAPPVAAAPVGLVAPGQSGSAQPPSAVTAFRGTKVTAYPRNGQSTEQQARDHYDCYRFGVEQSGFDPMHASVGVQSAEQQSAYDRAQSACFEGRGYSVR
jgi:hypothetical protein